MSLFTKPSPSDEFVVDIELQDQERRMEDTMVRLSKVEFLHDEMDELLDQVFLQGCEIYEAWGVFCRNEVGGIEFPYRTKLGKLPEPVIEEWMEFPDTDPISSLDGKEYMPGFTVFQDVKDAERWKGADVVLPVSVYGLCAKGLVAGQVTVTVARFLQIEEL